MSYLIIEMGKGSHIKIRIVPFVSLRDDSLRSSFVNRILHYKRVQNTLEKIPHIFKGNRSAIVCSLLFPKRIKICGPTTTATSNLGFVESDAAWKSTRENVQSLLNIFYLE